MASVLVSTVVTDFQVAFDDCDDTTALALFNRVHGDLLEMLPLKVTQEDKNIVSGTYEYTLNELSVKVWSVDYLTSATAGKRMIEVDYEQYNREVPNWRINPSGVPSQYSIWRSGSSIGLYVYPIPNTTTSAGYPIIRLDVSRVESLAASDMTPQGLGNTDIYLAGMCKRYAWLRKRDQFDFWDQRYKECLAFERHTNEGRSVQTKPMLVPDWMPRTYVV